MQRHHLRLVMTGVLTLVVLSPSAPARGSTALPSCPETAPGATGLDVIGRDDLPAGTDVVACDLVGTVVLLDGSGVAGAEIPPPGEGVQLFADPFFGRPTDAESELTVAVDDEGNLAYESDSPAAAGETPLAACDDPAYQLKAPRAPMNDGEPIHYDRGTFPGNLSANRVADTLIAGVRAWPRLYSDCDVADTVIVTAANGGDSDAPVSVTADGVCTAVANNSFSQIVFAPLDGYLGYTCRHLVYDDTTGTSSVDGADIRLASNLPAPYSWTLDGGHAGCAYGVDLPSIITHEAGHLWGLGHVIAAAHPNLTMRRGGAEAVICADRLATLGLGDIRGMKALY